MTRDQLEQWKLRQEWQNDVGPPEPFCANCDGYGRVILRRVATGVSGWTPCPCQGKGAGAMVGD